MSHRLLKPRARLAPIVAIVLAGVPAMVSVAAEPDRVAAAPTGRGPFRVVAPGVEITIPPDRQEEETFSTHDVIEILQSTPGLDWKPNHAPSSRTLREMATGTVFRRDIWCLEFTFKPVRMIWVDVPQSGNRVARKLIWYMVYHVKNTGGHLKSTPGEDGSFTTQPFDREVRFFPQFLLEAPEYKTAHADRIIPVAIAAIQRKEDPNRRLLNSVEISSKPIPVSTELVDRSVWGVATWEDVDPRVDFFSVYVEGLTNAYRWVDSPGDFKRGDPPGKGRTLLAKTLMLNFWRPGDEFVEDQRGIRYGSPDKVDHSWVYR